MIDREEDLQVCGEAGDIRSALEAIAVLRPDIVVVDISLNGPSGIELVRTIRQFNDTLRILILSMHDESVYAERVLRAGANGYIMKQEATEKVLDALRRILGGEVYVSERVAARMVKSIGGGSRKAGAQRSVVDTLTDREFEVFRLVGNGLGTRQISDALNLSTKTVETHYAHIKDKLGIKGGRELVQYAIEWALTEDQAAENPANATEKHVEKGRTQNDTA